MVYHFTFFILILLVSSYLKWVYCRHHIIGFCFFIQYENLYPFQGVFVSCISSVQFLSHVRLFATPWTAAHQASLSITNSQSLLRLMSIESVMHPRISSSSVPFFPCLRSFPASGSFPMSQFFTSGGQSIGASASASVLTMNIQD